jgi:hypothetical protein
MSRTPGEIVVQLNPDDVFRLASKGLGKKPIAKALGCCQGTLLKRIADTPEIADAYHAGQREAIENAIDEINRHAEKNPVVSIFKAKNVLKWHDNREVHHSGQINHVVTPAQEAWKNRLGSEQGDDPELVEGSHTPIEED